MLSRENRLKKKKDFQEVFKKGRGIKEDFLFLKASRNETKISRFGIIVTKKASKKAVIRNKIKRKIGEAVRKNMPQIKKGWDGIFIVSQSLGQEELVKIEKVTMRLLRKTKLLE